MDTSNPRPGRNRRLVGSGLAGLAMLLAACGSGSGDGDRLKSAEGHLDKGELAAALIEAKTAIERQPDSAQARRVLGQILARLGDPAAAVIELNKARQGGLPDEQVVPDLARAMLDHGDAAAVIGQFADQSLNSAAALADLKTTVGAAYLQRGEAQGARDAANAALQAQADFAPASILMAQVDLAEGQAPAALKRLDALLAQHPDNEQAGLLKGEVLIRSRGDYNGALEVFRAVAKAQPKSVPARTSIVNLLLREGKAADARNEFQQMKAVAANHPETLFLQARFAFDDKDYKSTQDITQKLLVRRPKQVRVLMLGAAAELQLKQYASAEILLARALKEAPGLLLARQMLARTYLSTGLPEKASEVLQAAADSDKADAQTLTLFGQAQLSIGNGQRAEAAFRRALKIAPADVEAKSSLAAIQLAQGDNGAAMAQLEALARDDSGSHAEMALIAAKLDRQDWKGALVAIDRLIRKAPAQAYPLELRGRVLMRSRDFAGAKLAFESALAKEPQHLGSVIGLTEVDLHTGRADAARRRFEDLIKADPRNVQARLALSALDTRLGAPELAAAAQLREVVRIDPLQALPHLMLIERLLAAGDLQGALVAAQEANAALPGDPVVLDALGRTQRVAGDSARAISTFGQLSSMQPRNAMHLVRLADAQLAARNPDGARLALRRALSLEPELFEARRGLAMVALTERKPQDAIAIAREIQKKQEKSASGFELEGEVEAAAKNWAAAASAFGAALQRQPSTDLAVRHHASLRAAGKASDAERAASAWIAAQPNDAGFRFHLGDEAMAANQWAKAEAHYRSVLALRPRSAIALNNVAWLMAVQGKAGGAALAEQALALLPDRPPFLDTLATALEAENQLPKAVDAQRRAAELDPRNPMLRLRLAKLLIKQGDRSGAREELQTLSRLGPAFPGQAEVQALLKTV